jgi:hypothetical protein
MKQTKIPLIIYYWHLERLLTTFPLFHFFLFQDYSYYTLNLHLILFLISLKVLKYYLLLYNKLETRDDYILLYLCSFSISLLLLIYILILWVFFKLYSNPFLFKYPTF